MRQRRSPILSAMLWVLAAVALLGAALWVFRVPIAETLIKDRLAQAGIALTQIDVRALGPFRVDIGNLRVAGKVLLAGAEADIAWPDLLHPRINRIVLSGFRLDLGISSSGVDWRGLSPLMKAMAATGAKPATAAGPPPDVVLRDAAVRISVSAGPELEFAGVSVSAAKAGQGAWDLKLGVDALRHAAATPAFAPIRIMGGGGWTKDGLVVDAAGSGAVSGAAPGLTGRLRLTRDTGSGEGEAKFQLTLVRFGDGGVSIRDLSPLVARYVKAISGALQASAKIAFNDAWATPVELVGDITNLDAVIDPAVIPQGMGGTSVSVDRVDFKISLPPASPERGRAGFAVTGGGLRIGGAAADGLGGDVYFDALWPPACHRARALDVGSGAGHAGAMFAACLEGGLRSSGTNQSKAAFADVMAALRRLLAGIK